MVVFAPQVCPQLLQVTQEFKAETRRAKFEGGYSQRSSTGPNSISQSVPLQWDVVSTVADYIDGFLRARRGVEVFHYELPWGTSELIWSCEDWSRAPLGLMNGQKMWRIRATFKQEFDII